MLTIEQWLEIGRTLGIGGIILVGVGLATWKGLWPFYKQQLEQAQQATKESIDKRSIAADRAEERLLRAAEKSQSDFLAALERRDVQFDAMSSNTRLVADTIQDMRREIKEQLAIIHQDVNRRRGT